MTRVLPRAVTPLAAEALPTRTRPAPTISRAYRTPGDFIAGASTRLIARAKALARTGFPSLKRNPCRSLNV